MLLVAIAAVTFLLSLFVVLGLAEEIVFYRRRRREEQEETKAGEPDDDERDVLEELGAREAGLELPPRTP